MPRMTAILLCAVLAAAPAWAQDDGAMTDAGPRYALRPEAGGFVRLDRQTGAMSFCKVEGGNLVCRLGAAERDAYEASLNDMTARIAALEKRLEALEKGSAPSPGAAAEPPAPLPPPAPGAEPEGKSSPEQEFDAAMKLAERAMRRFFDAIKELRSEFGKDEPAL